jgi:hypothetical protein
MNRIFTPQAKVTKFLLEEGVLYDTQRIIRSYQITLTFARTTGPTRLPLSKTLSPPDNVLYQRELTNFQKLLYIYTKSIKIGYIQSKKLKMFYLP